MSSPKTVTNVRNPPTAHEPVDSIETEQCSESRHDEVLDDVGVLELGCGQKPDPRSDTLVDVREVDDVDLVWDLDETPWPFADGSADGIVMHHVMEHLADPAAVMAEIDRILSPDGWVEIRVPIGTHWFSDPTHRQYWTYATPTYFADDEENEWNYYFDLSLELVDRTFTSLWFTLPGLSKTSPALRMRKRRGRDGPPTPR